MSGGRNSGGGGGGGGGGRRGSKDGRRGPKATTGTGGGSSRVSRGDLISLMGYFGSKMGGGSGAWVGSIRVLLVVVERGRSLPDEVRQRSGY